MAQTTALKVMSDKATIAAKPLPPWRRGGVSTNEASDVKIQVNPPWRRGVTTKAEAVSKDASDDDASTTTGCSDVEDNASTLSRSSSASDLSPVVSRDAMLLFRSRFLRTAAASENACGLHCKSLAPCGPPGLSKRAPAVPAGFVPPPGLEMVNGSVLQVPAYTPPSYRKEFMTILKDLALDRNVARAVRRVRAQGVPRERQAAEYADAITFILEETRGAARRSFVAMLAGLAYGVFERKQCIAGLETFFDSIYPDLQAEVPKLSKLVNMELIATLSSVFTAEEMAPFAAAAKA